MTDGTDYDEPQSEQDAEELHAPEEPLAEQHIQEPLPLAEQEPEAELPSAGTAEDDVAAAIAAAGANLESQPTLDGMAPAVVEDSLGGTIDTAPHAEQPATEPAATEQAAVVETDERPRHAVPVWPFVAYDVVWAAFSAYLIWQLEMLPSDTAIFDARIYPYAVLGGVVLTMAGPLLLLVVWIASWGSPGTTKGGLFVSSLTRGSVATLLGVLMWWGALMVLDQIRLGRLL